MSDSAFLTSAAHPPLRCQNRRVVTDDRLLLALSNGGNRRPAEVVEQSALAGVCGVSDATNTGSQWRSRQKRAQMGEFR